MADQPDATPQRFGWTVIPPVLIVSFFVVLCVWSTVDQYSARWQVRDDLNSSSSPAEDLKYRDLGQLGELCEEIDWDAIDSFVDIEDPIGPDVDNLKTIPTSSDWDTSCFATNNHQFGSYGAYASLGVAVLESSDDAELAFESMRNSPPTRMGSPDNLDCEPDVDDWPQGDVCRNDGSSPRMVQSLVRDENLVAVVGMLHARDYETDEEDVEPIMDEMAELSMDLLYQTRNVIVKDDG